MNEDKNLTVCIRVKHESISPPLILTVRRKATFLSLVCVCVHSLVLSVWLLTVQISCSLPPTMIRLLLS